MNDPIPSDPSDGSDGSNTCGVSDPSNAIRVSYDWTLSELLTASRYHARTLCRPAFRWAAGFLAVLFVLAGILSLSRQGPSVLSAVMIFIGLYLLFLRRWINRLVVKRRFASSTSRDGRITWIIAEDGLVSEAEGLARTEHSWAMFVKVVHTPKGFMMFQSKALFNWIPYSGFANSADLHRMKELIREKVEKVVVVK